VARFTIMSERHAPNVLSLSGDLTGATSAQLRTALASLLAGAPVDIVVDVSELGSLGAPLLAVVGDAATKAAACQSSITVRGPAAGLQAIDAATIALGIRLEETVALEVAASSSAGAAPRRRDAVTPGSPRREGAGFVSSYGKGRECHATGCHTELSRYNPRTTCAVHSPGRD
jgi:hypothetical protein